MAAARAASSLLRISAVPLGDVHPRLKLPDLDAGGDVGAPQRGIAPHDVKQAPADLAPQSLRSAGREDDRGVHEATAVGTDVIRVTPYRTALDPVGLEALRITERVMEPVEEMGEAGGVAEIARVFQDDVRHYYVSVRSSWRNVSMQGPNAQEHLKTKTAT
jgi:hypothetical protein